MAFSDIKGSTLDKSFNLYNTTEKDYKVAVRDYRNALHAYSSYDSEEVEKGSPLIKVLGFILFLLLLCTILTRLQFGYGYPTFTGLLEFLSAAERPKIPFLSFDNTTLPSWGMFNFLRDFFLSFSNLINILIFLANGIILLITYIVDLLVWIF